MPAIDKPVTATIAEIRHQFLEEIGTKPCHLIAVSKQQSFEKIKDALQAGQRHFGENKVQEAQEHWRDLRTEYDDLTLHMIGGIQSNKVADIVALFDVVHTLDRKKLVPLFKAEMDKQRRNLSFLVQVNTGLEDQKNGIAPQDLPDFLEYCNEQALPISGLMCIPPVDEEPSPHFALLAKLGARHGLLQLSMGMSSDYERALRFGATYIRVGSAFFGARQG